MTEVISQELLRKLRDSNYDPQYDHGLTSYHMNRLLEDAQEEFRRIEALYLRVKSAISLYSSVLAPIRRVPTEILLNVFTFLAYAPAEIDHSKRSRRPIWIASQVCRRWRQVVRSNSMLWSNLHIFTATPGQVEYLRRELETLLELSGTQPLHVQVHDSYLRAEDDGAVVVCPIFRAAYEHRARWKAVDLWISYRELYHMFQKPISLASLTDWKLKVHHPSSDTSFVIPDPVLLVTGQDAPLLRKVTVVDYTGPRTISLPWAQLAHISIQSCPVEKGLQILGQLGQNQALRYLELDCSDGAEPISASPMDVIPGSVHLPFLEKLVLSLDGIDDNSVRDSLLQRVLTRLYLPSLQTLCLFSIAPNLLHSLVTMLDQSGCLIRSLYLHNSRSLVPEASGPEIADFLATFSGRLFSQLRKLKLKDSRGWFFADGLLEALTARAQPDQPLFTLLPLLERLELDMARFTPDYLINMAGARIGTHVVGRKNFKVMMRRSSISEPPQMRTREVAESETETEQGENEAQAMKEELNRRLQTINEGGDGEIQVYFDG